MNNKIIVEPCSVIRSIARKELQGNWLYVTVGIFVYYVLMQVIPDIFQQFVPFAKQTQYNEYLQQDVSVSFIATFYMFFFMGVFTVGLCCFMIAFFRRKDINAGYLFNGFEYYFKCFSLMIMVCIFVILWSLLLIVPGVIAAFRYSQAFYILADDPDKGIMQCIAESKLMMTGNKAKLFLLDLSFIGWAILAAIPAGVVAEIPGLSNNDALLFVVLIVASIPMFIVSAYQQTANVAFYDLLTGHLAAKPAFNEADYHFVPKQINEEEQQAQQQQPEQSTEPEHSTETEHQVETPNINETEHH